MYNLYTYSYCSGRTEGKLLQVKGNTLTGNCNFILSLAKVLAQKLSMLGTSDLMCCCTTQI